MKSSPGFSIVIPTHNRLASLNACLRGIAQQNYPQDHVQVIVVNDGGSEIPHALKSAWEKEFDLLMVHQANGGPGAARNLGAQYAVRDWLAFVDDDCVPASEWLARFGETLSVHPDAVVGGQTRNGLPDNVYAEASQSLVLYLLEYYHRSGKRHSQIPFFTSNNMALARRVFESADGFDVRMRYAEERDLCARLVAAGYCLRYVPEARVDHFRTMQFKSFWRQHAAYGSGAFQYRQNRLRTGSRALRLEPVGFYLNMLGYPLRARVHHPWQVMGLIVIAQLANAYGFFRARAARGHTS